MKRIQTAEAPAAVGAYSQGIITGKLLFTAGQVALTPEGRLVNETLGAETDQIMYNLAAILGAAGCQFMNVVKTNIWIASQDCFSEVNAAYARHFAEGDILPARECVIAAPPLFGAHVEMSMIAEIP